eukprot:3901806-Pleurochrysis_carterae.AAC.1
MFWRCAYISLAACFSFPRECALLRQQIGGICRRKGHWHAEWPVRKMLLILLFGNVNGQRLTERLSVRYDN